MNLDIKTKKTNFIIIGAAKAGTTSLYKRLSMHPKIFMTTPKEPEFFARDDIYNNGVEWYLNLFSLAKEDQICGEASTIYSLTTCFPETVTRMHSLLPNIKIIYVIREPSERAYSYYTQLIKNYQNATKDFSANRTFEECLFPENYPNRVDRKKFFAPFDHHLLDNPDIFIGGGMYMTNIRSYLKFYPRENLLLIKFEDLVNDLDAIVGEVCDFLRIDNALLPMNESIKENVSNEHFLKIDKEAHKRSTIVKLKSIPLFDLISRLISKKIRRTIMDWFSGLFADKCISARPKKMTEDTRAYLKKLYRDEIDELEAFWGVDLKSWK